MPYTFEHLKFKPLLGGIGASIYFSNGYGASVIRHRGSYGSEKGLYELAVLLKQIAELPTA